PYTTLFRSEASSELLEPGGERPDVAEVEVAHAATALAELLDRLADGAVGGAPADDEHVALALALLERRGREDLPDVLHLLGAGERHLVVVRRVVGDVTRVRILLDAADAVLEARRAGLGPHARERLGVALERREALGIGVVFHLDRLELARVGDAPGLRAVRDEAV